MFLSCSSQNSEKESISKQKALTREKVLKVSSEFSRVDWKDYQHDDIKPIPKSVKYYEKVDYPEAKKTDFVIVDSDTLYLKEYLHYMPDGRFLRKDFYYGFIQYYYDSKGFLKLKIEQTKFHGGYLIDKVHRWIHNDDNLITQRYSYDLKDKKSIVSEFGSYYKYNFVKDTIKVYERIMLDDTDSEYAYKIYENNIFFDKRGRFIFWRNHELWLTNDDYDKVSVYDYDDNDKLIFRQQSRYKGKVYTDSFTYLNGKRIKEVRKTPSSNWQLDFFTYKDKIKKSNTYLFGKDSTYVHKHMNEIPISYLEREDKEEKDENGNIILEESKWSINTYEYQYDKNNNWVKKILYSQKKNGTGKKKKVFTKYRKIEYFKPGEKIYLPEIPIETEEEKERRGQFIDKLEKEE